MNARYDVNRIQHSKHIYFEYGSAAVMNCTHALLCTLHSADTTTELHGFGYYGKYFGFGRQSASALHCYINHLLNPDKTVVGGKALHCVSSARHKFIRASTRCHTMQNGCIYNNELMINFDASSERGEFK